MKVKIVKRRGNAFATGIRVHLIEKYGHKCLFPGCETDLVTPNGKDLGQICAIQSMSNTRPGGDMLYSSAEYFSIENYIYLCPTHHTVIDLMPEFYTVDYLRKLKIQHESKISGSSITKQEVPDELSLDQILKFWNDNSANGSEEFWQIFFSKHPQIISCLYPNPIIKIGEKAYLGGKGLDNKGGNIADYIYKNKLTNSIVIVEIKTPLSNLLGSKYRQNSFCISNELSGAIVQSLTYKHEIQRNFHVLSNTCKERFEVIEPSCIIVCGNLSKELLSLEQQRSFELFRSAFSNIVIITYDELFEKLEILKSWYDLQ